MSAQTPESIARDAMVLKWMKDIAALGCRKDLAKRLDISRKTLDSIIGRLREREHS